MKSTNLELENHFDIGPYENYDVSENLAMLNILDQNEFLQESRQRNHSQGILDIESLELPEDL